MTTTTELTKRMKNAVMQGFVLQIAFFMILTAVIVFSIYPKFVQALDERRQLQEVNTLINTTQKQGLSYDAFRTTLTNTGKSSDPYVRTLIKNVTPAFFSDHFTNTTDPDYATYLQSLAKNIATYKNDPAFIAKQDALNTILPVYSGITSAGHGGYTDFDFVNYIENLLFTFNLSSEGEIGVGNIEEIDASPESTGGDLSEKIYAIPMSLTLVGQKIDILDFIHYFENVGKIGVEDGNIIMYSDNVIRRPLEGESNSAGYNIYTHQIGEIESIHLEDYPDGSALPEDGDLISRLKRTQAREKMEAQIDFVFYVAGIPEYQMESYVEDTQDYYKQLKADVSQSITKYTQSEQLTQNGEALQSLENLKSLDTILMQMEPMMSELQKSLAAKDDIHIIYKTTSQYHTTLEQIEQAYDASTKVLTLQGS